MKRQDNMHTPFTRLLLTLALSAILTLSLGFTTFADDTAAREEDLLYYTALGDSIPNGYCASGTSELTSYPVLLASDLEAISKRELELSQFTKNGLTTSGLNTQFLSQPEVQACLAKADVITLTIGANDLMNEFKKVSREILDNETPFHTADEALTALEEGISGNPFLLVDVIGAVTGWDYDSFKDQWTAAVISINDLRKSGSQMAVTTIYNPVENAELPGTLNAVVTNLISKMNEIIYEYAEEYDYQVVDLLNSDIGSHTQPDGLHPDQRGQELIRNLIEASLDMQVFEDMGTAKEAELSEEAELARQRIEEEKRAAELREQKARQTRMLTACLIISGIFLFLLCLSALISRRSKSTSPKNMD